MSDDCRHDEDADRAEKAPPPKQPNIKVKPLAPWPEPGEADQRTRGRGLRKDLQGYARLGEQRARDAAA